jgi:hypothetical protein
MENLEHSNNRNMKDYLKVKKNLIIIRNTEG